MYRNLLINGMPAKSHRVGDTDFVNQYMLPEKADGPFCLLSRCGQFYRMDAKPRTIRECVATLMFPLAYKLVDGKFERAGDIELRHGPVSELNARWHSENGYVAAEIRMLN